MTLRQVQLSALFALSLVAFLALGSGVPALIGPTTIAPLVDKVKSTVVNISATKPRPQAWRENFLNDGDAYPRTVPLSGRVSLLMPKTAMS